MAKGYALRGGVRKRGAESQVSRIFNGYNPGDLSGGADLLDFTDVHAERGQVDLAYAGWVG